MKKQQKLSVMIAACLLTLFTGFSCETSKCESENRQLQITPLFSSETCDCNIVDNSNEDVQLLINSAIELAQYVTCSDQNCNQFNIDFNKYSLLIGKMKTNAVQAEVMSQSLIQNCDGSYNYQVKVKNGGFAALGSIIYGAVVPKIASKEQVKFNIETMD